MDQFSGKKGYVSYSETRGTLPEREVLLPCLGETKHSTLVGVTRNIQLLLFLHELCTMLHENAEFREWDARRAGCNLRVVLLD